MTLIIKGVRRLFPSIKRNSLSITKIIFQNITEDEPLLITDPNIDTALKVASAGFKRMDELTYKVVEA